MIRIEKLWYHYGIRWVLKDVNLHVDKGELICLMGPNGMGKSTLLGCIAGTLQPVKGQVVIDGLERSQSPGEDLEIRRRSYFMPDHPWLPGSRTGREFFEAVGSIYGVEKMRLREHSEKLIKLFNLEKKGESTIKSYSNGQKKKLAVAGALVSEAPILLLDEPFSGGMDPSAILALKKVMAWLADRDDITLIIASPVPEIVEHLAHRVAIMRRGELVACDTLEGLRRSTGCDGSLAEILEHIMHPRTRDHLRLYFEGED